MGQLLNAKEKKENENLSRYEYWLNNRKDEYISKLNERLSWKVFIYNNDWLPKEYWPIGINQIDNPQVQEFCKNHSRQFSHTDGTRRSAGDDTQ